MGKQGPCYHCGINYTPLWRNGPPEKPVLCNACGSRWRTKGTLANYVPLHARVTDNSNPSDYKSTYGKRGPANSKQVHNKRKETSQEFEYGVLDPEPPYLVGLDDDASNGSSSASGISYSEGCMQYGIPVGADNTGAALTSLWDSPIPSRKRTCIYRKRPSSVAKLTQGLRYMMDKHDSSSLSGFSEDLLFPCKSPISAAEIGLGSYFIKQLQAAKQDDESEASSILVDNRGHNTPHVVVHVQAMEASKTMHMQRERESSNVRQPQKLILLEQVESGPNHLLLEGSHCDKLDVLQSYHSPLIFVELKDILNYESFMGMLTTHEQKHLMAYVSPIDSCNFPDSLHSMFKSFQFEEALNNYQKLLSEGIFDMNILGPHLHLKKTLQKHIMTDLTSTKWLEIYLKPEIKAIAVKSKESIKVNPFNMFSTSSTYLAAEEALAVHTGHTDGMKSHVNMQNRNGSAHSKSSHFDHAMKNTMELNFRSNSRCDIDDGFASSLPSSLIDPKGHIGIEGLERDLLLNVPSNASFQQAELLDPSVLKSANDDSFSNARNFEYSNSEEEMAGNLWGLDDNLEWSGLLWSPSKLF